MVVVLNTGKTNQVLRKGEKLGIAYEVSTVNSLNMSAELYVQTVSSSDEVDIKTYLALMKEAVL